MILREEGPGVLDGRSVGRVPAEVRLLHEVLGLGQRTQHPVAQAGQVPAVPLEVLGGSRVFARHHATWGSCRFTATGVPPTLTRLQA